ncbi:DUF3667 domain-containing protein [Ekhidna sp.]|uniref:DUF3667 domain-containing protein n=1 Tax=Ekhidna sp. TaxID=2608089 RepID=UPI00329863A6
MDKLICKSCNTQFVGEYCNQCGEKVINQEDRKLTHFLSDFVNAITFMDNKFWRTIKLVIKAPGQFSENFADGRRKAFMRPVSLFFLANLLYFLIPTFNTFTTNLDIQRVAFWHSDLAVEMVDKEVAKRGIEYADYRKVYDQKTAELSKLFLIIMAVILALFFWPVHIGSKRTLFADHLTLGLELMTFILLFCIMFMALFLQSFSLIGLNILSDDTLTTGSLILLLYFFIQAERKFYGIRKIRRIINAILGVVIVVIALSIYRALLFFITFWVV